MKLEERIRRLERELLQLRRDIGRDIEALPREPFDAIELTVGGGCYALPIAPVREVLQMVWCEPLADAPSWLMGTFSYGSEVVPVADLRERLEGVRSECDPQLTLVVVEAPTLVGFAVQAVGDLRRVEPAKVTPPAEGIPQAPFLLGTLVDGERQIRLLSSRRLARDFVLDSLPEGTRVN